MHGGKEAKRPRAELHECAGRSPFEVRSGVVAIEESVGFDAVDTLNVGDETREVARVKAFADGLSPGVCRVDDSGVDQELVIATGSVGGGSEFLPRGLCCFFRDFVDEKVLADLGHFVEDLSSVNEAKGSTFRDATLLERFEEVGEGRVGFAHACEFGSRNDFSDVADLAKVTLVEIFGPDSARVGTEGEPDGEELFDGETDSEKSVGCDHVTSGGSEVETEDFSTAEAGVGVGKTGDLFVGSAETDAFVGVAESGDEHLGHGV